MKESEEDNYKHSEVTEKIIKSFYKVYNSLGFGFLEKVYLNALSYELMLNGLIVEKEKPIKVFYREMNVGDYYADIIVNGVVIVELKAIDSLAEAHDNQLINYLKATEAEVGLLLNFGKKPEIRRKVFSNNKKNHI